MRCSVGLSRKAFRYQSRRSVSGEKNSGAKKSAKQNSFVSRSKMRSDGSVNSRLLKMMKRR